MPDSSSVGSYTESSIVIIPCTYNGEAVDYMAQIYLVDGPLITANREVWGFAKHYSHLKLEVVQDTMTGTLHYTGERVAMGTMAYKHECACGDLEPCKKTLEETHVNLKLIPCGTGESRIAQLVAYNLSQIQLKGI